ncbi:LysR family transcriptional regulator [Pseudoteredinibacter isoporae]|uniref:LysR family transcriptional regulator n=1 Tax=Pseudoteredinibacter isoporae TaxID=570281 RepID=UPI003108D137
MKNWDDYRLILALHRTQTLRGAADLLGVNHSTVSRRLTVVQHQLGHLFERTLDGYQATSLGLEFVNTALQIENLSESMGRRQRGQNDDMSGPINLSIPPPIAQTLLIGELKGFSERYPNIQLNINSSFELRNLERAEADIVIRGTDQPPEYLVGRRVASVKLHYYGLREYLNTTAAEHYQWIGRDADEQNPQWIKDSPYPNARIGIRSDDILMRHQLLLSGYGLSRGACYMADPCEELVRLNDTPAIHLTDLWVLVHPDLRETPRIKVLMQFLCEALLKKKSLIEGKQP